jgi:hypothetical protein
MIATCLIYMIFMQFSHKNSTNPSIHAKHVECDYLPLPSKFEMNFNQLSSLHVCHLLFSQHKGKMIES